MKAFLIFLCFIPIVSRATIKYTIDEGWEFRLGEDSRWERVDLPHTWNSRDAVDDIPGYYRGVGWYRKSLYIDSSAANKAVSLYFDGANQVAELYVNDKLVGIHKGGYTRFSFDISKYIKPGALNLVVVKVDNSHNVSIPPLTADFTFFGGIYRHVYLVVKEKSALSLRDFASDGVYVRTRSVSAEKAVIEVETLVDGAGKVVQSIITPDGKEISFQGREMTIGKPLLWSPDTPRLYTLKTVVMEAGKVVDQQLNVFGLRWFRFDAATGFFLNGRPIKLMGANRHQTYLDKGNALPDEIHVEDIRLLKEMGGNLLRISHYPQDPLILEMCDKLGIIASVEVPIVNEISETDEFQQNSLQMATEMVKQNFNHPSVVIWAYMNEVMLKPPFASDSVRHQRYCKEVNRQAVAIEALLRRLDPGRYTMIPFHGALKRYEETGLVRVPMIVGWNLYQGWYGGTFSEFDRFVADFHTKYPTMPVIITEYGADVDERLHSLSPERFDFTEEYGDLYHEHYLKAILAAPYIAGGAIWNLNDFYSESRGDAVPHVNTKGITTLDRGLKNTYLLYRVFLSKGPMAYIGSKSWKYRAGPSVQPVKIYSNQESVDVYHNGVFFKKVALPDHYVSVGVPFTNGRNTIELRIDNKAYDFAEMNYGSDELNVMLGSNRYFEDRDARIVWTPEQPYVSGSWGYVGGKAVRSKTKNGSLPSSPLNILGTGNDPIFQTQREDLQAFKADVSDGQYAVYLYWANLTEGSGASVYNLGNNAVGGGRSSSVMNVFVNGQLVLPHFEVATASAIIKKILVDVTDGKGITVNLEALSGRTILNAIRIIKLN
ncbi:MAG: beta-galactosidase [Bacteroidetes bacterium]|nr:beta-galactosidase [Bacteroidota bacterium]